MSNRPGSMRIATIYSADDCSDFRPYHMSHTRWLRMSECLANLGYHVDIIFNTGRGVVERGRRLRIVPSSIGAITM